MALSPGTRLGPYEVVAALGAGGMGEVYRATDTRLRREVALKVLPDLFAGDPDRLARFEREAQILASLNHPHIAAIHGLEEAHGVQALVLELVEGPTLADRIAQGRIPLDEALPIARQIAEALEAAHEYGIVHRDLKPANIKLRVDGTVKVLDFGLAKLCGTAATDASQPAHAVLANSPTITSPSLTVRGMILGTAAYMSPEQAKGKAADRRSDVWAFGCVLFEMLTGARAFAGDDVSDTLASVLRAEPAWAALPVDTPDALHRLLRRSLEKDPRRRLSDLSAARLEIDDALSAPALPATQKVEPTASAPLWRRALPLLVTGATVGALAGFLGWSLKPVSRLHVSRSRYIAPEGQQITAGSGGRQAIAISPDGARMAYIANQRLYLRSMSELDARAIPGSETLQGNVANPVFSPDGESIAFMTLGIGIGGPGTLYRIPVSGGTAQTICPVPSTNFGLSWGADGILFGLGGEGVMRVSPNGGQPEKIVSVNDGEEASFPEMLPGNKAVLFTVVTGPLSRGDRWDAAKVVVQSLTTGERKTLVEAGSEARYLPTGHIVYAVGGTLFAVPFDANGHEVTGPRVPIVEGVRRGALGTAHFSVSTTGTLIFMPGPAGSTLVEPRDFVLLDREGRVERLKMPSGTYFSPRISHDGRQFAFESNDGNEAIIWIADLSGATPMRRLTFGGSNRFPVWSPDGQRIAFQSNREGDLGIFWQRADTPGGAERLTKPEQGTAHIPESWSPKGDLLSFSAMSSGVALWVYSFQDKKATPFGDVRSFTLLNSEFSPDGRWLTYTYRSPIGGDANVFVEPVPPTGTKFQITKENGHHAVWSPDGKELSYRVGQTQQNVVSVTTQPTFVVGNPSPLKGEHGVMPFGGSRNYDITRDGKRFLIVVPAMRSESAVSNLREIQIVLNWFEELGRRAPAGR